MTPYFLPHSSGIKVKVKHLVAFIFQNFTNSCNFLSCVTVHILCSANKWHTCVHIYFSSFFTFNKKHVLAAHYTHFSKIGRHVGGCLGLLGPHHDSNQSPSIFLHLRLSRSYKWPLFNFMFLTKRLWYWNEFLPTYVFFSKWTKFKRCF